MAPTQSTTRDPSPRSHSGNTIAVPHAAPDGALDALIRLAAAALDAPVAFVSIVEENGLVLKSVRGLPLLEESTLEPLLSFLYQHVSASPAALVIEDAREHSLGGVVAALGLVSCVVNPLMAPGGFTMGYMCIADTQPRTWNEEDIQALECLATGVLAAVDRGRGVTRSEQAADAVQSLEYFRSLAENAADSISVASAGGIIRYETPSVERELGYGPDERIGKSIFAWVHPDDVPLVMSTFTGVTKQLGRSASIEYRVRHQNGSWHVLEATIRNLLSDPSVAGIVINARDVTARAQAQAARTQLSAILDATPDLVAITNPHGRLLYLNRAGRKIAGISDDADVSQLNITDFHPPWATDLIVREGIPTTRRDGAWSGETAILGQDGREIPVSQVILAHRTPAGEVEFLSTTARDITDQKRAEEVLRRSERDYRELFENAHDPILISDPESGLVLEVNPRACEVYGFQRAEFLGMPMKQLSSDAASDPTRVWRAVSESGSYQYESIHIRKDGGEIFLEINATPVNYRGRCAILSINRDITERKHAERQLQESEEHLRQAQKMEAVGRFAGGVAHDFNNLLTAITGFSQLLEMELEQPDPRREYLLEIQTAADRAASLTQQLLTFSRKQVSQPRVLDLNAEVAETDKLLRRLIGEDIELVTELEQDLGLVQADPGQIQQVLMNLVVNARDAMPQGGRLTIETANVELDHTYTPGYPTPRPYVLLTVCDTGCGMDRETQGRIFEPFFTTKEQGRGTGLGLSTVYAIVQQSGGFIRVESAIGEGSTFRIYFPRAEAERQAPRSAATAAEIPKGWETILLVEDEESVRVLARTVLRRSGYSVLEASNGVDALRLLQLHTGPLHLLLTDVVMPQMGGKELAALVMNLCPTIQVLYMSGYTGDAIANHGIFTEESNFLAKPFRPDTLAREVRKVLDARSVASDVPSGRDTRVV